MPLKTDAMEEPNLNLTPMIDIVFLLIIFFMVGTQFAKEDPTLFDIQLASTTSTAALTPGPDPVVIALSADGQIRMDKQPVTMEQLEQGLKDRQAKYPDQSVIIGGEGQADLQQVVDVMDVCKRIGLRRFTLAAKRNATPPGTR